MKKNIIRFFYFAVAIAFTTCFLSGCKDDNSCKLKVIVQDVSDSSIRIPGANIHISKGDGNVTADGVTDNKGEAFFTFENEAIFDINVTKVIGGGEPDRSGKSTVRLIPGETVTKVVLLQK